MRCDITLDDFVGERHDPVWGTSDYQQSGREVLAEVESRRAESTWYDADGNWIPPVPAPKRKRAKNAPDEVDAVAVMGSEWVQKFRNARLPRDLVELTGSPAQRVQVSAHTLNTVAIGGKHDRDRAYLENLQEILENASLVTPSPRKTGWARWEVYTPIHSDWYALTIVGGDDSLNDVGIVTFYLVPASTVKNRMNPAHTSGAGRVFNGRTRGK